MATIDRRQAALGGRSNPSAAAGKSFTYPLRELRRARGLTQAQVAERLSVSQATISKFERSNPAISTVRRYIKALGGELELVAVFDRDEMVIDC